MLYLYLDESGDLGFDFVSKKPSKFFTVCILLIKGEESRKRIVTAVKRTLRKKLNPKNKRKRFVREIKGASTTIQIKQYFFKKIEEVDFRIYGITLNKKRLYQRLVEDKSRVYNWVTRLLLDNIDFLSAENCITFIIDKSKSKPQIEEFNSYINRQLEAKIDPKIPLDIKHIDSCCDLCLNAVDLFSWGIFRKYERKDTAWYNVFKGKVKFDDVYLPEK